MEYEPSPVPSDDTLWPGELPFTAWGQHEYGSLDLRVFEQAIWWVDISQVPHRLTDMSENYLRNVIAHLRRHADGFHQATIYRDVLQIWGDLLLGRFPSDVIAIALGATPLTDLTPSEWLEGTPLMRGLVRELHRRDEV